MNHFKPKSLAFYGIAIAAVLILFNVVTAYGEKNLKASAPVEGRYRLQLAQNLPNCPQSPDLALDIQQSGIYFNASLLPANIDPAKATASQKRPTISGKMNNQTLSMTGKVPGSTLCNTQASQQINIQTQIDGKTLKGQIALAGIPKAIEFTAQKAPSQPSGNSSSHS